MDRRVTDFLNALDQLQKDTGLTLVAYDGCIGPGIGLYDLKAGDYVATAVGYNDKKGAYEYTQA
jgi:hypothetical protein